MKIAIYNPWTDSAENEVQERIRIAAERIGFQTQTFRFNADIEDWKPDVVLSLAFHHARATTQPRALALWTPESRIRQKAHFITPIASFDILLTPTPGLKRFGRSILESCGKPVVTAEFYPSGYSVTPGGNVTESSYLVYSGNNWDNRTDAATSSIGGFFQEAERQAASEQPELPFRVYGPPESWQHFPGIYHGSIPFDGRSFIPTYGAGGILLCLQSDLHYRDGVPSMRIFDACSAGALAICDDTSFIREHFKDTVLYVDRTLDPQTMYQTIADHVRWARSNPETANNMVEAAQKIYNERFTYEVGLLNLKASLETWKNQQADKARALDNSTHHIDLIAQPDNDEINAFAATVKSLAEQRFSKLRLIIAGKRLSSANRTAINRVCKEHEIDCMMTGESDIQDTLSHVRAPYFGLVRPGDRYAPEHYTALVASLSQVKKQVPSIACSATILRKPQSGLPDHFRGEDSPRPRKWYCNPDDAQHLYAYPQYTGAGTSEPDFIGTGTWLGNKDFREAVLAEESRTIEGVNQTALHCRNKIFNWIPSCLMDSRTPTCELQTPGRRHLSEYSLQGKAFASMTRFTGSILHAPDTRCTHLQSISWPHMPTFSSTQSFGHYALTRVCAWSDNEVGTNESGSFSIAWETTSPQEWASPRLLAAIESGYTFYNADGWTDTADFSLKRTPVRGQSQLIGLQKEGPFTVVALLIASQTNESQFTFDVNVNGFTRSVQFTRTAFQPSGEKRFHLGMVHAYGFKESLCLDVSSLCALQDFSLIQAWQESIQEAQVPDSLKGLMLHAAESNRLNRGKLTTTAPLQPQLTASLTTPDGLLAGMRNHFSIPHHLLMHPYLEMTFDPSEPSPAACLFALNGKPVLPVKTQCHTNTVLLPLPDLNVFNDALDVCIISTDSPISTISHVCARQLPYDNIRTRGILPAKRPCVKKSREIAFGPTLLRQAYGAVQEWWVAHPDPSKALHLTFHHVQVEAPGNFIVRIGNEDISCEARGRGALQVIHATVPQALSQKLSFLPIRLFCAGTSCQEPPSFWAGHLTYETLSWKNGKG